jgi:hypothetical protein
VKLDRSRSQAIVGDIWWSPESWSWGSARTSGGATAAVNCRVLRPGDTNTQAHLRFDSQSCARRQPEREVPVRRHPGPVPVPVPDPDPDHVPVPAPVVVVVVVALHRTRRELTKAARAASCRVLPQLCHWSAPDRGPWTSLGLPQRPERSCHNRSR